jgi:hypothetical protein
MEPGDYRIEDAEALVESGIAGLLEKQPVLVSSQLDRGSEPRSPPEGLANHLNRHQSRSSIS